MRKTPDEAHGFIRMNQKTRPIPMEKIALNFT